MPDDEPLPVELFEPRNQAYCKFCGQSIYWIAFGGKWRAYELTTRLPHPRCISKSNLRIWKYK